MTASRPSRTRPARRASGPRLAIELATFCRAATLDRAACRLLLRRIAADHNIAGGEISVAVVDRDTIGRLHARFLDDPSPTDVLSFVLARRDGWLEGEIVACAEVAAQVARRLRRPAADELLLYVVHGMLHLVGYDDRTPAQARQMRRQERAYLAPGRRAGERR